MLIVFRGLPGVGKSTLARETARRLGAIWLRVDVIEAALLKAGLAKSFETGLAAYVVAEDVAADHLRVGQSVVVDAVNARHEDQEVWRSLAAATASDLCALEVVCSDPAEHRRRVEHREPATPPLPVPTWPEVLGRDYEPWGPPLLTVDTVVPAEQCIETVFGFLGDPATKPRSGSASPESGRATGR